MTRSFFVAEEGRGGVHRGAGEDWHVLVVEGARLGLCEDSHALATLRRWAAQRSAGAPRWDEPVQRHTDGLWLPLRPVRISQGLVGVQECTGNGGAGAAFSDLGASCPSEGARADASGTAHAVPWAAGLQGG